MEEHKPQAPSKWQAKLSVDLKATSPDQAWPYLADFCNIHKCLPSVATSYQVDGVSGQPGLVRYCAAPPVDDNVSTIKWANEKLLWIDPIERSLSYEVTENNLGFKSYVAVMQVVPINGEDGGSGCKLDWSFVCDPIEGLGFDDLLSFIESSAQLIAKTITENVLAANTTVR